jgi:hypothetical protein
MTENLLFVMGLWEVLEHIPTMGHEKNPDDSFKPGRKLWDPVREKKMNRGK